MSWTRSLLGVLGAVAIIALLSYGLTRDPRALPSTMPGQPAPAFELQRLGAADTIRSADYAGQVVVLNFWASWCIPCRTEAPLLQEAWERYRDDGLVVLGIDAQDLRGDARRFVERYGLTYPIAYDGNGASLGRFGTTGFPETWFVGRDGRLVGEHIVGEFDREQLERNVQAALDTPAR